MHGSRAADIEALTGKYQAETFDGMTDSYNHRPADLVATPLVTCPSWAATGRSTYSTRATLPAAEHIDAQP